MATKKAKTAPGMSETDHRVVGLNMKYILDDLDVVARLLPVRSKDRLAAVIASEALWALRDRLDTLMRKDLSRKPRDIDSIYFGDRK